MIKKLLVAAMLALSTPAMSAECLNQSQTQIVERLQEMGAVMKAIPQSVVKDMVEKMGPPPGNDGTVDDISLGQVDIDDQSALFVFQKGCFIYRIGPSTRENVEQFLRRFMTQASN